MDLPPPPPPTSAAAGDQPARAPASAPTLLSLPTAARTRWRVQASIVGMILSLLLSVPTVVIALVAGRGVVAVTVPPLLAVVGVGCGVTWANRRYLRFGYQLSDDQLRVRDGVITHSDVIAPMYRVQHVDLTRGPLQLSFGLATLAVHTAAPAADIRLPDLAVADAERLRDAILEASRAAAAELGVADVDAV